jgi:ribosomal protein S27E
MSSVYDPAQDDVRCEWCGATATVRITIEPARFGTVKQGNGKQRKTLTQREIVAAACDSCAQRVKQPALTPPPARSRRESGQLDVFDLLHGGKAG